MEAARINIGPDRLGHIMTSAEMVTALDERKIHTKDFATKLLEFTQNSSQVLVKGSRPGASRGTMTAALLEDVPLTFSIDSPEGKEAAVDGRPQRRAKSVSPSRLMYSRHTFNASPIHLPPAVQSAKKSQRKYGSSKQDRTQRRKSKLIVPTQGIGAMSEVKNGLGDAIAADFGHGIVNAKARARTKRLAELQRIKDWEQRKDREHAARKKMLLPPEVCKAL